jgi:hypothetical protein
MTFVVARKDLSDLAVISYETSDAFDRQKKAQPVDQLVGTAASWCGLLQRPAMYTL